MMLTNLTKFMKHACKDLKNYKELKFTKTTQFWMICTEIENFSLKNPNGLSEETVGLTISVSEVSITSSLKEEILI